VRLTAPFPQLGSVVAALLDHAVRGLGRPKGRGFEPSPPSPSGSKPVPGVVPPPPLNGLWGEDRGGGAGSRRERRQGGGEVEGGGHRIVENGTAHGRPRVPDMSKHMNGLAAWVGKQVDRGSQ
jgi:hypothetical protein